MATWRTPRTAQEPRGAGWASYQRPRPGQGDGEARALALRGVHGDATAGGLHHPAHDGEAEAAASPVAPHLPVSLENAGERLPGNPDARILDRYQHFAIRLGEAHADGAPSRSEAHGVRGQVDH